MENNANINPSGSHLWFYLRVGGILLLICAAIALMLAGVNALTAPTIAENQRIETENAIAALFPENARCEPAPNVLLTAPVSELWAVYNKEGNVYGFCVFTTVQGFKDVIDMLVGVSAAGEIIGVRIMNMSETPGLGTEVSKDGYLAQYQGLHAGSAPFSINADVDAVAGATISSKAILQGVNAALALEGVYSDISDISDGGSVTDEIS